MLPDANRLKGIMNWLGRKIVLFTFGNPHEPKGSSTGIQEQESNPYLAIENLFFFISHLQDRITQIHINITPSPGNIIPVGKSGVIRV